MPSKAEKSRRRAARGIGPNGIPQEPTTMPTRGVKAPTTAPAQDTNIPAPATANEAPSSSSKRDAAPATQPSPSSQSLPAMPAVHRDSVAEIWMNVTKAFADGTTTTTAERFGAVPAAKLLCASNRFEEFFKTQPKNTDKQTFRFLVDGPGITRDAVEGFMDWLLSFRCPFPSSFKGTKYVPPQHDWTTGEIADLLVFCRWLDLKAPFSTRQIDDHLWDYFKDKKAVVDPAVLCSLWASPSPLETRLHAFAVRRAVEYVEMTAKTNKSDVTHEAFVSAFAFNSNLRDAYEAQVQRRRVEQEAQEKRKQERVKRKEEEREEKKYREWKAKENEKKKMHKEAQRLLLDRRGVTTISAEEARGLKG